MKIPIQYPIDDLGVDYLISKINRIIPEKKTVCYDKKKNIFDIVLSGTLLLSEAEIVKQINQAANNYIATKYSYLNNYPQCSKKDVSVYGYSIDSVGNSILSDKALAIFEDFKNIFSSIEIELTQELTTAFIAKNVLEKARYDENFPQNFHLVDSTSKNIGKVATTPAVCYHIYENLENKILNEFSKYSVTGTCFRTEEKISEHRLGSFHMHEIVFFGSANEVELYRENVINKVWEIFMKLKFSGQVEIAADPFFDNNKNKIEVQIDSKIKFELVGNIENYSIAIASFNIHNTHFSKLFNIKYKEQYASSGCIAFGIERWVYLFLIVYGSVDKLPSEIMKGC